MKKLMLTTSAVALALSLPLAANALTLNVQGGVDASAGASAGMSGSSDTSTSGSASVSASGSGSADSQSVIHAFDNEQVAINAINSLEADSKVTVVRLGAVAKTDAFGKAMMDNASATANLQAAIDAKTDLKAQLEDNDIAVASIVAADLAADGAVVLYSNS